MCVRWLTCLMLATATTINHCRGDAEMRAIPPDQRDGGASSFRRAWLGGQRGVMLMQSSGVGNCPNMIATSVTCRLAKRPITMRGEFGGVQLPAAANGAECRGASEKQMGSLIYRLDDADDAGQTVAAAAIAFESLCPAAVLIGQRLIGTKKFGKG